MEFSRILNNVNVIQVFGTNTDPIINGITSDSREVGKGWIFVAIKGFITDGHNYLSQVISAGAAVIVVEDSSVLQKYSNDKKIVLIKNNANLGYSAGNNVGLRYAIKKNIQALLIINPDVRFKQSDGLNKMVETMLSDRNIV